MSALVLAALWTSATLCAQTLRYQDRTPPGGSALLTREVGRDATENFTGRFNPSPGTASATVGHQLASAVSGARGPVAFTSTCTAVAGPDDFICVGSNYLLDGVGSSATGCIPGVEYQWLEGPTLMCIFSGSPQCAVVTPSPGPHVYTLEYRCLDLSCFDSAPMTLTVNPCVTLDVTGCTSSATCALGGAGSANGQVDPGEDVLTTPTVRNTGTMTATNVIATVTSPTPGVTITQGAVFFGDILAAASAPSLAPAAYTVSPGFTCGNPIQLDLAITSDQGPGSGSCSVSVPASCDRCLPIPCNLTVPVCAVNACLGGCPGDVAVRHEMLAPCSTGGSFDLTGTRYESTCAGGSACLIDVPPLRLWGYDSYEGANSGCETVLLVNPGLDPGPTGPTGHWVVTTSWSLPRIDGCVNSSAVRRTVAELSFPELANEGTVDHSSRYLVLSVPEARPDAYDLDVAKGSASACGNKDLPTVLVPPPAITGRSGSCTGSTEVLEGIPNARYGFFQAPVVYTAPKPSQYSESGADQGPVLVEGYQGLYVLGSSEPRTSDVLGGGWLAVFDPADPSRRLGVDPTEGPSTVAIPNGRVGDRAWLAARLVYHDPLNPLGTFDVAELGPLVVSYASSHCGPLARPRLIDSEAFYDQPSVGVGLGIKLNIVVRNTADPALSLVPGDAADVTVVIRFAPCVNTSVFNPAIDVTATFPIDPPVWAPPILTIHFTNPVPASEPYPAITITGLGAEGTNGSCCTVAQISHGNNPNYVPAPACFTITNCLPQPMTGFRLAKSSRGTTLLSWDPLANPGATIGINVWKLLGGNPRLISSANAANAPAIPTSILRRVCQSAPLDTTCLDAETTPGSLAFYQVRSVCIDGTESP